MFFNVVSKPLKFVLACTLLCLTFTTQAQSNKTKAALEEIRGQWSLDSNGNVTYTRIVEVNDLPHHEIYNRAYEYFIYNYTPGDFETFVHEPQIGRLVVRGIYDDVHSRIGVGHTLVVDTWHIIRIDVKEGKARLILTLSEYGKDIINDDGSSYFRSARVGNDYPIKDVGNTKNAMGKAFLKSHDLAQKTLFGLEKAIREGNVDEGGVNEDW